MLRQFLFLYLRDKVDKIISDTILIFIIILGLLFLDLFPPFEWYIYLSFGVLFLLFLLLLMIRGVRRTCIILDTKVKRYKFLDETGLQPLKEDKLLKSYKKWLIKDAKANNLDIQRKPKSSTSGISYCFYCCYCIIPFMLIFGSILIIYTPQIVQMIIIPSIFIGLALTYFLIQKRIYHHLYKEMNSETKQIVFEEETGYKPIIKGKFTFKYKAWLIQNEKKEVGSI